jgi:alcohol dehydrogenase
MTQPMNQPMNQPSHPAQTRKGTGVGADGTFNMPTRVQFGRGVVSTLAEEAKLFGVHRVMVVTDPGVLATGLVEPLVQDLRSSGFDVTIFDKVQPNPRDLHCMEGAALAADQGVELLVGVGGGSPIDTAKCIGVLLTNGGHPRDWEDFGALKADPTPVIAIPTTAGTGSEVSPSSIVTDTERKKKMNLFDPRICPRVALVDPDLTFSVPAHVTAATGMDALSHSIDSLHCLLDTPASDAMALEGARLNALFLERAVTDGGDVEARCGMAQASLVAGLAVGITDVSGCHSIAEAIGATYDHPHGVCCAIGLPMIMEYNLPASADKYARLAQMFGINTFGLLDQEAGLAAITYVRERNARLGIPALSELIDEADVDLLAQKAFANTSTPSNPLSPDLAAFRLMFVRELERDRAVGAERSSG